MIVSDIIDRLSMGLFRKINLLHEMEDPSSMGNEAEDELTLDIHILSPGETKRLVHTLLECESVEKIVVSQPICEHEVGKHLFKVCELVTKRNDLAREIEGIKRPSSYSSFREDYAKKGYGWLMSSILGFFSWLRYPQQAVDKKINHLQEEIKKLNSELSYASGSFQSAIDNANPPDIEEKRRKLIERRNSPTPILRFGLAPKRLPKGDVGASSIDEKDNKIKKVLR